MVRLVGKEEAGSGHGSVQMEQPSARLGTKVLQMSGYIVDCCQKSWVYSLKLCLACCYEYMDGLI